MKRLSILILACLLHACGCDHAFAQNFVGDTSVVSLSDLRPYQTDGIQKLEQKILLLHGAAAARINSTAYEASHVLKSTPGALVSLVGYNSGSAGFIQIFDSATLPADGAAPALVFAVPGTGNFSLDVALVGMPFSNGITVCISSTAPTKTIASASLYLTAVVK